MIEVKVNKEAHSEKNKKQNAWWKEKRAKRKRKR